MATRPAVHLALLCLAFAVARQDAPPSSPQDNEAVVLFTEEGSVGAPCAYGHLTFALDRDDLTRRFFARASAVLQHFLEHRVPFHRTCDPTTDKNCLLHELHDNATFEHVYVGQLRAIERATRQVTEEMTLMIFGRGATDRQKRFIELAALAVFDVLSFGLTIKNSVDIATFNHKLETVESRIDAIVHLDDEILKTQVRDHAMIERLVNSTQR